MGDSDIIPFLSAVAVIVIAVAVVAFVLAWRIRKQSVHLVVGTLLLAVAAFCGILSFWAALFVIALGIGYLILAVRTPTQEIARPETQRETEP